MVREGLEGALAPHLRESFPSRRGRPQKGLARGPARIELRWIPGDHRINPARGGGGKEASRRWKGMRVEPSHMDAVLDKLIQSGHAITTGEGLGAPGSHPSTPALQLGLEKIRSYALE